MYRLTVNNAETYWIVMRNVFSCQITVHLKFDLKGSTVDRTASDKEKVFISLSTVIICFHMAIINIIFYK